jgi:cytochrome c553
MKYSIKYTALAALVLGAGLQQASAQNAGAAQPSACEACHGPNGNSIQPKVPRLNGQTAEYLTARLTALRDPTKQSIRAIHAMWDLANHIGDAQVQGFAQYYASQTPTQPDHRISSLAKEGARLYQKGAHNVPACSGCHGPAGEGSGAFPRLAGQHGQYLDYQMTAFSVTMRYHPGMDQNAMYLTQDQIKALVAYLAKD